MSISQTLRGAVQEIRRRGWQRGPSLYRDSACCAEDAIAGAEGRDVAISFVVNFLQTEFLGAANLIYFNDHECESADDVIALFEIGADIAECDERAAITSGSE